MSDMRTCETPGCDAPAEKVVEGHDYCSNPSHRNYTAEAPVPRCSVAGCGCAGDRLLGGQIFCFHHAPLGERRAA